jgi:hypothetical protein
VTDIPTWVLLVLRIALGNQYTRDTTKAENHIAGKAQIGVKVTLTSSLFLWNIFKFSSMSNLSYPLNPDSAIFQATEHQLPVWRIPFEVSRRRQRFEFILANIKIIAEPDRIQYPIRGPGGKGRRLNQPFFPPLSHFVLPTY